MPGRGGSRRPCGERDADPALGGPDVLERFKT
jgi:hypothetical protein